MVADSAVDRGHSTARRHAAAGRNYQSRTSSPRIGTSHGSAARPAADWMRVASAGPTGLQGGLGLRAQRSAGVRRETPRLGSGPGPGRSWFFVAPAAQQPFLPPPPFFFAAGAGFVFVLVIVFAAAGSTALDLGFAAGVSAFFGLPIASFPSNRGSDQTPLTTVVTDANVADNTDMRRSPDPMPRSRPCRHRSRPRQSSSHTVRGAVRSSNFTSPTRCDPSDYSARVDAASGSWSREGSSSGCNVRTRAKPGRSSSMRPT